MQHSFEQRLNSFQNNEPAAWGQVRKSFTTCIIQRFDENHEKKQQKNNKARRRAINDDLKRNPLITPPSPRPPNPTSPVENLSSSNDPCKHAMDGDANVF